MRTLGIMRGLGKKVYKDHWGNEAFKTKEGKKAQHEAWRITNASGSRELHKLCHKTVPVDDTTFK